MQHDCRVCCAFTFSDKSAMSKLGLMYVVPSSIWKQGVYRCVISSFCSFSTIQTPKTHHPRTQDSRRIQSVASTVKPVAKARCHRNQEENQKYRRIRTNVPKRPRPDFECHTFRTRPSLLRNATLALMSPSDKRWCSGYPSVSRYTMKANTKHCRRSCVRSCVCAGALAVSLS